MADATLVLHIGLPKCGSSSIQASFSNTPMFQTLDGRNAAYGTLMPNCKILLGDQVRNRAKSVLSGYATSVPRAQLAKMSQAQWADWRDTVRSAQLGSLLLSHESWAGGPELVKKHLAPFWEGELKIIAFVRPQLEFFNSGWWQWGAWTGDTFETWFNRTKTLGNMISRLEVFRELFPGVEIAVHPLNERVIANCLSALNCAEGQVAPLRSNSSLSAPVLRLMQRHAARLRTEHGSGIDFAIGRSMEPTSQAPWVIPPAFGRETIASFKDGNLRLLEFMNLEDAAAVKADARWWDFDAYGDRKLEPWEPVEPDVHEVDALAADLAEALAKFARFN